MSAALQPRPGFDWSRVRFGAPDARVADDCSYCEAPLGEGEAPLMLFTKKGAMAQFCEDCQERWWGAATIHD